MLLLKPTTIIALDAYAAAFCEASCARLERDFGLRGRLIQSHALTFSKPKGAEFVSLPSAFSDSTFDLGSERARERAGAVSAKAVAETFKHDSDKLEGALSLILRTGRKASEIESALRDGVRIAEERVVYLVLSSSEPFAGEVVLQVIRLIRWLFAKRFTGEPYSLHVIVLLPDLLVGHGPSHYGTTYALFKGLDHVAASKIQLTPTQKVEAFDTCWLMDARNARAVEIGTLAENLASYADAFAGFLTAEPERSGALAGTLTTRGKMAAYSSFGHGELFFPVEVAITRLSANLAGEIIVRGFLGEEAAPPENRRKLLLAVKQFLLSKEFENALAGLDQLQGAAIWQNFRPTAKFVDTAPQEYIAELQRRHVDFERESLIGFRQALVDRSQHVGVELSALLDAEIDRRADADRNGLTEALEFLKVLVEPTIALESELLGERPRNLLTEHSLAEASLDGPLNVVVDREPSVSLLDQIHDTRGQISTLQRRLRLLGPAPELPSAALQTAGHNHSGAKKEYERALGPDGKVTEESIGAAEEDRQEVVQKLEEMQREVPLQCEQYREAVEEEERIAGQLRREQGRKVREARIATIQSTEQQLLSLGNQLSTARQSLTELRQVRREFLRRFLLLYPFIVVVLFIGLPLLGALGDIGPARELVSFFGENVTSLSLVLLVMALIYLAAVYWIYRNGINRKVDEATAKVKMLVSSVEASAVQLVRAHNDQLHLDYQLFALSVRTETIARLIEYSRQATDQLRKTLSSLQVAQVEFAKLHTESTPPSTVMRRSAVSAEDLDAYYHKVIQNVTVEADFFTRDHVKRSQARRLSPDEFRAKLNTFARGRFAQLEDLSIADVLLRPDKLVSKSDALRRLKELSDIAEPLVRLRELETGTQNFAQRDTTLWIATEEREKILEHWTKICPDTSVRPHNDKRTLRVLSRSLNFPAYFVGAIEYYRDCYEQASEREAQNLPDLLPIDSEVRRAHEQLLLALVFGSVTRRTSGEYTLANRPEKPLGTVRRQIAEKFAKDFGMQDLYGELVSGVSRALSNNHNVYTRLEEWRAKQSDLDNLERELLDGLAQKYHPLR